VNVLDLFSGIGGFSLGLERAGMRTVAFCEINDYCRRILKKHWPDVPCYENVRSLTAAGLRADGIIPDVICGGFPCQDISLAGIGAGLEGGRSGLWWEYARLIEEFRPAWVIIENVAALRNRGLGTVLRKLASLGYDAEWHCIPACAVGAPHQRDRIWIIAHSHHDEGRRVEPQRGSQGRDSIAARDGAGRSVGVVVSDAEGGGRAMRRRSPWDDGHIVRLDAAGVGEVWRAEPDVGRVADGVPDRVDRLTALGNAVVPQIPELIGRAIMTSVQTL
jgi:DNA (cytosine-5)-methyltransferase 1